MPIATSYCTLGGVLRWFVYNFARGTFWPVGPSTCSFLPENSCQQQSVAAWSSLCLTLRVFSIIIAAAEFPAMDDLGGGAEFENECCDLHAAKDDVFTGSYTHLLLGEPLDPGRVFKQTHGYEQDALMTGKASLGSRGVSDEALQEESELNAVASRSRGVHLPKLDPRRGSTVNSTPPGLIRRSTPSTLANFMAETYKSMRIYSLEVPAGEYVLEFLTRFARTNSRPGVALTVTGGNGTVCNLKLQGPWRDDLRVEGNAEIVTISKTFQADWWGSMKGTSVAIMVLNSSHELCGGTVKGDMQAVDQVHLNVCIFS